MTRQPQASPQRYGRHCGQQNPCPLTTLQQTDHGLMWGHCCYPLLLPLIILVSDHEAPCLPHVRPLEFAHVRLLLIGSLAAEVHRNSNAGFRTSSRMTNLCLICLPCFSLRLFSLNTSATDQAI